jgi:hypothetical protein
MNGLAGKFALIACLGRAEAEQFAQAAELSARKPPYFATTPLAGAGSANESP